MPAAVVGGPHFELVSAEALGTPACQAVGQHTWRRHPSSPERRWTGLVTQQRPEGYTGSHRCWTRGHHLLENAPWDNPDVARRADCRAIRRAGNVAEDEAVICVRLDASATATQVGRF
jgi:hypothetical protein